MEYLIYKHTSPSGKLYIGYTSDTIDERWRIHLRDSKNKEWKFSKALRKYPNENQWKHEILIDNIPTLEEAKNLEVLCIFYYDTFINGYNSTIGGDGVGRLSEETKRKISKTQKDRFKNPIIRKQRSEQAIFQWKNPKLRKLRSELTTRQFKDFESRREMSEKLKGRKQSEKQIKDKIKRQSLNWLIIYPNGKKKLIKNLNNFCKKNNLIPPSMYRVSSGIRKHHRGFSCKKLV